MVALRSPSLELLDQLGHGDKGGRLLRRCPGAPRQVERLRHRGASNFALENTKRLPGEAPVWVSGESEKDRPPDTLRKAASKHAKSRRASPLTGLRRCGASESARLQLEEEAAALGGAFALKWNSLGTVTERSVFSGGGSASGAAPFGESWEPGRTCVCACGLTAGQGRLVAGLVLLAMQGHFLLEVSDTFQLLFFRTTMSIYKQYQRFRVISPGTSVARRQHLLLLAQGPGSGQQLIT